MVVNRVCIATTLGPLTLEEQGGYVQAIYWGGQLTTTADTPVLRQAVSAVHRSLAGDPSVVWPPCQLLATPFQKRVYDVLTAIPWGATRSYQEVAQILGNRGWARAVGCACRCNRYHLKIPCHRVIASNGTLGGYAGGLLVKSALLQLEARQSAFYDGAGPA